MKKEDLIDALISSPATYWKERDRQEMRRMTKVELQDQYDMLDEAEDDYYDNRYEDEEDLEQ